MMPMNQPNPDFGDEDLVDEICSPNASTNRWGMTRQSETQDRAPIAGTPLVGKGAANPDASGDIQKGQSTSQDGGATADTAVGRNCAANPGVHSSVGTRQGQSTPQDGRTAADTVVDINGAANPGAVASKSTRRARSTVQASEDP